MLSMTSLAASVTDSRCGHVGCFEPHQREGPGGRTLTSVPQLIDFNRLHNSAVLMWQFQQSSNTPRLSSKNCCTCLSSFVERTLPATTLPLSIAMDALTPRGLKVSGGSIAT